jgi:hypothetical protein
MRFSLVIAVSHAEVSSPKACSVPTAAAVGTTTLHPGDKGVLALTACRIIADFGACFDHVRLYVINGWNVYRTGG